MFLFAGTVGDNISLGDPPMSRQRIEAAARDTNADRFIQRLPHAYDQPVGERGVSLSSGQRQLLSFARVLAADPEILVLDEATANVDTETEMWNQEAVGRLMRKRTSLVIAHRLSTVSPADAILVLNHGEVREMGTHEELLDQRGGIVPILVEIAQAPIVTYDTRSSDGRSLASVTKGACSGQAIGIKEARQTNGESRQSGPRSDGAVGRSGCSS